MNEISGRHSRIARASQSNCKPGWTTFGEPSFKTRFVSFGSAPAICCFILSFIQLQYRLAKAQVLSFCSTPSLAGCGTANLPQTLRPRPPLCWNGAFVRSFLETTGMPQWD
jgi:hypothetical protein